MTKYTNLAAYFTTFALIILTSITIAPKAVATPDTEVNTQNKLPKELPLYDRIHRPEPVDVDLNIFADVATMIDKTIENITEPEPEIIEVKPDALNAEQPVDINTSGNIGKASAYNDGTVTALGEPLTTTDHTCAVPLSQRHLLGTYVSITYDDITITAKINDLGGFEAYGRILDLNLGCIKTFGFDDIYNWGVRDVYYEFLG